MIQPDLFNFALLPHVRSSEFGLSFISNIEESMNYEKNFLLVVLVTYLSMACSHNEVDCSKLQNDENLKKEFILGFAEAPTTFTAERNAEKEITGFFSNYVRYSSSYSSYDSEKSSGIEIEEDIKSSGAFDIGGAQTLCALKKEKTAQVLKGLSKSSETQN